MSEVSQELGFVNDSDSLHRLDLDEHLPFDDNVKSVRGSEGDFLINNGNHYLSGDGKPRHP